MSAKKKDIKLRDYQQECLDAIMNEPPGTSMLVQMATGLGKTATFTSIPRKPDQRILILARGEELVLNPIDYYSCDVGIEMAQYHAIRTKPNTPIVVASVQSMVNRLEEYKRDAFDIVIADEAHHAPSPTFRKCLDYFQHKLYRIGFTATPKRYDNVRLDDLFSKIVFNRDLIWGIKNGYLCNIYPRRVQINTDLRGVKIIRNENGEMDFDIRELGRAMAKSAPAIAEVYRTYAFGSTIIYVANQHIAYSLEKEIPGSHAITDKTNKKDRAQWIDEFRNGKVKCLISVDVLREGVDAPITSTILMARPTMSATVYQQCVGRGVRLYDNKKALNLIDIEGILGDDITLCSASTLAGIDLKTIPKNQRALLNGLMITEMQEKAEELADTPESWLMNAKTVAAWEETTGYDMHNVNWYAMPDGRFELKFSRRKDANDTNSKTEKYMAVIPPADALGRVQFGSVRMPLQIAFDLYRELLDARYKDTAVLWDRERISQTWGTAPATPNQLKFITNKLPNIDTSALTKAQASNLIARLIANERGDENSDEKQIYPVNPESAPKHFRGIEEVHVKRNISFVYDYLPDPRYIMYGTERRFVDDFMEWFRSSIENEYNLRGKNIYALIQVLNQTNRWTFSQMFIAQNPKYKYLCSLDNHSIARMDLYERIARLADIAAPILINDICLQEKLNDIETGTKKQKNYAIPDLENPPLCHIHYAFEPSKKIAQKAKRIMLPPAVRDNERNEIASWIDEQKVLDSKKGGSKRGRKKTAK